MRNAVFFALTMLLFTSAQAWAQIERDTTSRTRPQRSSGQFSEDFLSGDERLAPPEEPAAVEPMLSAAQAVMAQAIAASIEAYAVEALAALITEEPIPASDEPAAMALAEPAATPDPLAGSDAIEPSPPSAADDTATPAEALPALATAPSLATYDWGFPADDQTAADTPRAAEPKPDAPIADTDVAENTEPSPLPDPTPAGDAATIPSADAWHDWEPADGLRYLPAQEPEREFDGPDSAGPVPDLSATVEPEPAGPAQATPLPGTAAGGLADPDQVLASLELLREGTLPGDAATNFAALAQPGQPAPAANLGLGLPGAPLVIAPGSWPPSMPDYPISPKLEELSRGNTREKVVALTFDDGPHPEYTSQILAVLDYYNVPATFFFVGVQAQKYPQWVQMASQSGHEIASQTYDHFRMPKLPREEKIYQIDEYQRLIERLTSQTPRFLRPPGGQLDDETRGLLNERGMILGLWDVAINDTGEYRTKDELLSVSLNHVRSGSVLLTHDGIQATVDMLPELIETLRQRGYRFVTMSELASLAN